MDNKQIIILTDEGNSYIPIATLVVDKSVDLKDVEKDIEKVKNELPGEWQLTDILNGVSADYKDVYFSSISL